MDTVVSLISSMRQQDDIGNWISTESKSEIFAAVNSISRSEWNSAGVTGFKPALMVSTPAVNYSGQEELEVNGKRYGIYRTYCDGDNIELYCELKAGVRYVESD